MGIKFPYFGNTFPSTSKKRKLFPRLSFQDRGFIDECLPVIPFSLPFPDRTEDGNDHGHHHDYGQGPAHAHAPGLSQARMVQIEHHQEPDPEEPPEQDIHHGASFPFLRP